jgi:hypothetical protein
MARHSAPLSFAGLSARSEGLRLRDPAECGGPQYWTLVTVRFEDEEASDGSNRSRIVLTHGVFDNDADRDMHEQGWFGCLTLLERLVDEG